MKSGVEKQYHGGSLVASYNFPYQENFILYGIGKRNLCFTTSLKFATNNQFHGLNNILDNPSTLFGTVFVADVPGHPVGVYSFHFQDQANCWLDFSKSNYGHYRRHDGTKPTS